MSIGDALETNGQLKRTTERSVAELKGGVLTKRTVRGSKPRGRVEGEERPMSGHDRAVGRGAAHLPRNLGRGARDPGRREPRAFLTAKKRHSDTEKHG